MAEPSTQTEQNPPFQNSPFRRLGLVSKPAHAQNAAGRASLSHLAAWLTQHCEACWLETSTAKQLNVSNPSCGLVDLPSKVDAIVVVGGDGTMLAAARELAAHNIPLIGINQGHLGFMTDLAVLNFEDRKSVV